MADFLEISKRWHWPSLLNGLVLGGLATLFLIGVPGARPDTSTAAFHTVGLVNNYLFDFVEWEAATLVDKGGNALIAPQRYMTSDEQVQYVRDYLALVGKIQQLDRAISALYTDPETLDPDDKSLALRRERDFLRAEQAQKQALAEAIIEAQVSEEIVRQGYQTLGGVWPPVSVRFTQLPTILILSPRNRIERTGTYPLAHGLTVEKQETLEASLEKKLGVSALIAPLGGLAVYPAMVIESSAVPFVYEVAAHEWMHHYLAFYPLGFNYGTTPELYTMNETVASIVGKEIGWEVLNRYYPEISLARPDYAPSSAIPAPPPDGPPAFDFRREMRQTRVQAESLLRAGLIDQAERYMEDRRRLFVANGYQIRRLNQAYFAFYGAYADEDGATGGDPIGPMIRELRYHSPTLKAFTDRMRSVTSREELEAVVRQARQEASGR